MSAPPTVSIVTPSYRQLDWLRLAIASVEDQTGVTIEHIVQDAGTEGIEDVLLRSKTADNSRYSLKLFVEKDRGMYDAINRGLSKASGHICAYLNCDEQYLPSALAKVAEFFAANPEVEILFGDAILVDGNGGPFSYRRTVLPILSHVRYAHLNVPTCSIFFRRTILDRGFLFEPEWKIIGDQIWVENLLRAGTRMAVIPEPLAIFTFTGENLSETAQSLEEGARRRDSLPIGASLRKTIAVIWHRMRKLFAGAYRHRQIDIEIYTLKSPFARQHRIARVGFFWWHR